MCQYLVFLWSGVHDGCKGTEWTLLKPFNLGLLQFPHLDVLSPLCKGMGLQGFLQGGQIEIVVTLAKAPKLSFAFPNGNVRSSLNAFQAVQVTTLKIKKHVLYTSMFPNDQ